MHRFPSLETPSMAPMMWHTLRDIRAMMSRTTTSDPKCPSPRSSMGSSSWHKSTFVQDTVERFARATRYVAAVRGRAIQCAVGVRSRAVSSSLERTTRIQAFELRDVVGQGTFGTVHVARHVETGAAVAVKTLPRHLVRARQQQTNVLREQGAHLGLTHGFIARLYATFQDTDAVYFVLEFCIGGELYGLVYMQDEGQWEEEDEGEDDSDEEERRRTRGRLVPHVQERSESVTTESESDEDQQQQQQHQYGPSRAMGRTSLTLENFLAKQQLRSSHGGLYERHVAFYAACVVSALEYVHGRGMLYRDLKLENLVLDAEGYPKLIDFGLAKPNATWMSERSSTMCGSAEYMAPEILQHKPYDQRVDVWSFGILVYEMLFGKTPFYHANYREQSRRIISEPVQFPVDYEQGHSSVCSLIQKLLEKDPALRLASFGEVRNTTFFRTYFPSPQGWQQLESRQVQAPFVPRLDGPFDTSLFERVQDADEHGYGSDADLDFGY